VLGFYWGQIVRHQNHLRGLWVGRHQRLELLGEVQGRAPLGHADLTQT